MKTWMFALLEALIAALGLAAFFLAENVVLASAAAVMAAALGIAQPLLAARKGVRLERFQDRQYRKALAGFDGQLGELDAELIPPPLPHRPTVASLLQQRLGDESAELLREYDELAQAIEMELPDAVRMSAWLGSHLGSEALGEHLQGLAAYAVDDLEAAHRHFTAATQAQPGWIAPWLGWAASAYQLRLWDEISEGHPHLHGVDFQPFDAGDESTFLKLSKPERNELVAQFQAAAAALMNYNALVELGRSKQQAAAARDEWKRVA
jgi:hypothetical protein